MAKLVCGYAIDGASSPSEAVVARFGVEEGCIDVGRDDDGEIRSFTRSAGATLPRLFEPPRLSSLPLDHDASAEAAHITQAFSPASLQDRLRDLFAHVRLRGRRPWLVGGVGVGVVFLLVAILPTGTRTDVNVPQPSASVPSLAGSESLSRSDGADPQSAAIDLALTGAISGLGSMQGVPRSSVTAVVASRAGEIVLVDVTVTKTTGLTAFATVLLQKVGTQWRMRQVVDGRN